MTLKRILTALLQCLLLPATVLAESDRTCINAGWLFIQEDTPDAYRPDFDDSGWRQLDIPHDWAFENGYSKTGAQGDKGGYASGGIGWYRKHIDIPGELLKGKLFLDFDAVYMNSEVWINGHKLGKRPYGYISFSYEISRHAVPGDNVISVRVDNSLEPSARWYHGCGIYGNVYLRAENRLHFIKDGIHVRTREISNSKATVSVDYEISMAGTGTAVAWVTKDGKKVSGKVSGNGNVISIKVSNPQLWSPETPELYNLHIVLKDNGGRTTDSEEIRFGFKTTAWDAETGFWLNGENVKLRGVCEHLEGGPVGAMWTKDLLEWKLRMLKDMGCNAIRTAHNPQLPFFYDLCDEIGLLVMDEAFDGWKQKATHDYGAQAFAEWWERDLRAMVRRDRNHPCVFIYSVGNETKGEVAADLVRVCHEEDPDRMVTSGHSGPEVMDILGVNGNSEKKTFIESYIPEEKAFIGTETPHTWQTRGFYRTQTWYRDGYPNKWQTPFEIPDLTEREIFGYDWISPEKRRNVKQVFNSSYDNATVRLTARHNLEILRDSSWYSGHFRWTGFDYLGEAGYVHGGWPFRAFMGGVIDLAGFRKDHYYLYQSQWREDLDMIHILPHWTHPDMEEGTLVPVWAYTTGDEAELFLNGKSMGKKKRGLHWNEMQCEWLVPWTPGTLRAVAYRGGIQIAETSVSTSGTGTDISAHKDGCAGNTGIFTFSTVDKDGNLFPYGDNRIFLRIPDGSEILSFENGNPTDTECNFRATSRRAFFGLCRAFIRNGNRGRMIYGCINGDRSMKMSDTVTITAGAIGMADGCHEAAGFRIRYTVDGTEPCAASMPYTGPFKVSAGTTVKAVVIEGEETVLKMHESFGDGSGIHWGTPGEAVCNSTGLQAEYAVLHKAVVQNNSGEDVNGAGYVRMKQGAASHGTRKMMEGR